MTSPLSALDALARHAPAIFGRAIDPDALALCLSPGTGARGRAPSLDNNTPSVRAALSALRVLQQLHAGTAEERRAAEIVFYAHVVCGEAARGTTGAQAEIALRYTRITLPAEPTLPVPVTGRRRKGLSEEERREREAQRRRHNGWKARQRKAAVVGLELYLAARAVYMERMRRVA